MLSHSGRERSGEERGAVRLGCVVLLLLIAIGVYAAVLVLGTEFDYRSLQNSVEQEVRIAETQSDEEIRSHILNRVRELELPKSAERISVQRLPGGAAVVSIRYRDTVTFVGRWDWVRDRRIRIRGPR